MKSVIFTILLAGIVVLTVQGLLLPATLALSKHKPPKDQATYERAVNMTLDAVMSIHDEHKGKMTWGELNAAVCARMKVKRTEPWERTKQ